MNRSLIAGLLLGTGLISGGMLMQSGAWTQADAATGTPRLLDQVIARLQRDYIDSLDIDELRRKAATGLVKELEDSYSEVLTSARVRRMQESASGRYAGIGVEIDIRDDFVTVIAPIAGSPADSAGVRPGDRIITIDGKSTHRWTLDDVQRAMRGAVGSRISLGIDRSGEELPEFELTRRVVRYNPVQRAELLRPTIGYIELATFSQDAAMEVRRAVERLRGEGASALILDLRSNPGGLLEQGIEVADLFLDAGKSIAATRGRTAEANADFRDDQAQRWPDVALAVLVDSGSASAAEIVAGALQDHDRAVLIGTGTYGKGSAQSLYPLTEGMALKLTTAKWFTPEGRSIERDSTTGGIDPDIVVNPPKTTAVDAPLVSDPVIVKAIGLLEGVRGPRELRSRVPRANKR